MSVRRHRARTVVPAMLSALVLTACGGGGQETAAEPAPAPVPEVQAGGAFTAPPGPIVTYDAALVPVGATGSVRASESGGSTTVTLEVGGLLPDRRYGAHAHTQPCGAEGAAAGPHYQFEQDPVSPSVDPAYANPGNEIWLDLTTDAQGAGRATATVPWAFPADRRAASVIVHAMPTATEAGRAGTAGDRAACITVDF